MSESNNNIPMRITQLEEATAYEDGMYYAVAKAGAGTKKISCDMASPQINNLKTLLNINTILDCYISSNGNIIAGSGGVDVTAVVNIEENIYYDVKCLNNNRFRISLSNELFEDETINSKVVFDDSSKNEAIIYSSNYKYMYIYMSTVGNNCPFYVAPSAYNSIQNKTYINDIEKYSGAINRPILEETIGAYLSGNGSAYYSDTNFKYTEPFFVKAGTIINIKAKGYSTVVNILSSTTDGGASYTEVIRCTDSIYKWYTTTITTDTYLIACSTTDSEIIIYEYDNTTTEIEDIKEVLNPLTLEWESTNAYLSGDSSNYNSNANFIYSKPFYIGGECTLYIKAKGYSTVVNILSRVASPNGGYYLEKCRCTDSNYKWYKVIVEEIGYYIVCGNKDSEIKVYVANWHKSENINILSMFSKLICCGDSLTYGLVYTGSTTYRQAKVPYNEALQKITGVTSERYATAGYTSKDWWDNYNSHLNENGLYIVFLGTNGGLTDTISTDCVGDDPSNYADTNTGCYGKILQTLINNSKTAVLIKPPSTSETTQSVIEKFSKRYGFPTITLPPELANNYYHYAPHNINVKNDVHYNDVGYVYIANGIVNAVNNLTPQQLFAIAPY